MDTRSRFSRRALLLVLAATVAACAETTPRWGSSFGNSVRATFAAQVAQPAAVRNADPVAGTDGHSARAAHRAYERANSENTSAPAPMMDGGGAK